MRRAVVMAGAAAASEGSACHLIRALCQWTWLPCGPVGRLAPNSSWRSPARRGSD